MTTHDRLTRILADEYKLPAEAMQPDARLEDLGIDSLAVMDLLFKIEDEFAIRVPNDQVALVTMGDLVDYVDRLIAQQADGETRHQAKA